MLPRSFEKKKKLLQNKNRERETFHCQVYSHPTLGGGRVGGCGADKEVQSSGNTEATVSVWDLKMRSVFPDVTWIVAVGCCL